MNQNFLGVKNEICIFVARWNTCYDSGEDKMAVHLDLLQIGRLGMKDMFSPHDWE
jgi:hypothetical protein